MFLLDNLLSSDAFTPVNKRIARDLGFLCAGFLGELIRQRKRFGSHEFFFSQKDMEEELGISPYQQRECIKKLKSRNLLSVTKKGVPAKNYYEIHEANLVFLLNSKLSRNLTTGSEETGPLGVQKLDDSYNKNDNKNDNKKRYIESLELNDRFLDFLEMRKKIKSPPTERAIKSLLKKLEELSKGKHERKKLIIEQSIVNNRKDFFILKNPPKRKIPLYVD